MELIHLTLNLSRNEKGYVSINPRHDKLTSLWPTVENEGSQEISPKIKQMACS